MNQSASFWSLLAEQAILPRTVYVYVGVLVLIFVWNAVAFLWRLRAVHAGVGNGAKVTSSLKDEESFTSQFTSIDGRLSSNAILGDSWREFRECLIHPDEQGGVIKNSRDPGEYFHSSAIIDRHLSIRYYNAVPNVLTGLGILGTFTGLAAGVYLAQRGLVSSDIDQLQQALGQLLGGASLAFVTSIAGLLLSLLFLFLERFTLGRLQGNLQSFVRKLDSVLARVTPEHILIDQLSELRKQSTELRSFNNDLAFSIANALDDRLSRRLTPALEQLLESMDRLKEQQELSGKATVHALDEGISQRLAPPLEGLQAAMQGLSESQQSSSEETIRSMVEQFRSTMSQSTNQEFQRITDTLGEVDKRLRESSERMEARDRAFRDAMEQMLERSTSSLVNGSEQARRDIDDGLRSLLEGVTQAVGSLQYTFSEGQGRMAALLEESVQSLRSQTEESVGLSTRALAGAAESVAERLDETSLRLTGELGLAATRLRAETEQSIGQSGRAMASAADQVASRLDETSLRLSRDLETSAERLRAHTEEGLQSTTQALSAAVDSVAARLDQTSSHLTQQFSSSASDLGAQIGQLHEHVRSVNQLVEAVRGAAERMTTASDKSALVVQRFSELESVLRSASEDMAQGGRSSEQAAVVVRDAVVGVRQAITSLQESQGVMAQSWGEHRARFESLDGRLAEIFRQIDTGLQGYATRTRELYGGLDGHLSSALESLGGLVQDLNDNLEDFREDVRNGRPVS